MADVGICPHCRVKCKKNAQGKCATHKYKNTGSTKCPGSGKPAGPLYQTGTFAREGNDGQKYNVTVIDGRE